MKLLFLSTSIFFCLLIAIASAANITATSVITSGGSMILSTSATPSVSDTLDGTDQIVSYSIPLNITDVRGSGQG